jgi:hypothetical protein
MMPSMGSSPRRGRSPHTPHSEAGIRIEPAVSVPRAPSAPPVATATAEPPLDPPAMRSESHGLRHAGVTTP